jgi:hypothetical protein
VTSAGERRSNATPNQIPVIAPVPAVPGHLCDVCSAVFPKSAAQVRGMNIHVFSFFPLAIALAAAEYSDKLTYETGISKS